MTTDLCFEKKASIHYTHQQIQYTHNTSPSPNPITFEQHCHEFYELLYIVRGNGKYIAEGIEYPLHPHALFLEPPYEYHSVYPDSNRTYERIVLHFESSVLPDAVKNLPLLHQKSGTYFSLQTPDSPVCASFDVLHTLDERSHGQTFQASENEALLCSTLTQILLLLTNEHPVPPHAEESGTVRRIIEYLNQHLTEELSLDDLAKEFFISKYHLCRLFRSQTGASIFTYFNTKRMALAKQLLKSGDTATVVAAKLGYKEYSAFYRAYRKQTGESPVRRLTNNETEP